MSVIARIEGLEDGYTLIAKYGQEVRGVIEPITMGEGNPLYFMTIYGQQNAEKISFEAIDQATGESISLEGQVVFNQEEHLGSLASPVSLKLGGDLESSLDLAVYPNPFSDELTIKMPKTSEHLPEMTIVNLTGQILGQLEVIDQGNQWSAVLRSNRLELKSGLYIIRVMLDHQYYDFKIIKQ